MSSRRLNRLVGETIYVALDDRLVRVIKAWHVVIHSGATKTIVRIFMVDLLALIFVWDGMVWEAVFHGQGARSRTSAKPKKCEAHIIFLVALVNASPNIVVRNYD